MEREAELARLGKEAQLPDRRQGLTIPMHVRPTTDGRTTLVHAETGAVISPCSSPEVAEQTKAFFA
jgi:hypothetical protein